LDLGDLDGDGLLDVVVADPVDGALHVLLGEIGGRFTPSLPFPAVPGVSQVDLGDVDGDGDLDAASRGGLGELWLSPGDGAGGLGGGVAIPTGWGRASG